MHVYIITMFISIIISLFSSKKRNIDYIKNKKIINLKNMTIDKIKFSYYINMFLAAIPFIFISSIRKEVGTDYNTYTTKQIPDILDGVGSYIEIGYILLVKVFYKIFNNYQCIFIITSIIIIVLIFKYIYDESCYIWLSIYIFVASSIFNQSMNIMRQFIAVAIFLNSIKYIIDRNWLKYFTLIFISSCFHRTAIIFYALYFYKYLNINKINKKLMIIFMALIGVFSENIRSIFFSISSKIGFYEQYFSISSAETKISYPLLLLNIIIYVISIYFIEYEKNNKLLELYFFIELLIISSIVLSPIIPLAYRIIFMFMPIHCVYIPLLIKKIKYKKYKKIITIFLILVYLVFFVYYIGIKNYGETLPYKTIFNLKF